MRVVTDLTRRAMDQLVELAESAYGFGWKAEIDRRLGQTRGALGKAIQRGSLRLDTFFHILQILDIRPSQLFADLEEAPFPNTNARIDGLTKSLGRAPELRALAKALPLGPDCATPITSHPVLEAIAQTKTEDAVRTLGLIRSALDLLTAGGLPEGLTLPLLIERAGCHQRLDEIEQALGDLLFVYETARRLGSRRAEAEALLRLPECLVRHSADYRMALELATTAYLAFTDLGDRTGAGKALVVRGRNLHYLENHSVAAQNLRLALEHLPETEPRYHFAANLSLAIVYKDMGRPEEAQRQIDLASTLSQHADQQMTGSLYWADAGVSKALAQERRAEDSFRRARALLFDVSPISAALVSIDFAQYYLDREQPAQAVAVTKKLIPLLESLARYPIAEAAITELIRIVLSGATLTSLALRQAAEILRGANALTRSY